MATPFEEFVNTELPKRLSSQANPLAMKAGLIPLTTGVGLTVEFVDPTLEFPAGDAGQSAYSIAIEHGFEGTEAEWLTSLHGKDGKDGNIGPVGPVGPGTHIAGVASSQDELPDATESQENGNAYLIGKHIWVAVNGEWNDMGDLSGPEGVGLRIKGSLPDIESLPTENNLPGDAYMVNRDLQIWDGTNWVVFGQEGRDGKSAYDIAVSAGFEGPEYLWLQSLQGIQGEDGEQGEKGDAGPQGVPGPGTHIVGYVEKLEDLPDAIAAAESNEAYILGKHVYVPVAGQWVDMGDLSGPEGTGLHIKGSLPGTGNLPTENNEEGDSYIVDRTLWVWDSKNWVEFGHDGPPGQSVFDLAVENGYTGTAAMWLASLKGEKGDKGEKGEVGLKGDGAEVLRLKGSIGIDSSLPDTGNIAGDTWLYRSHMYSWLGSQWQDLGRFNGYGAYELAQINGFGGELDDWLKSLKGTDGTNGKDGKDGEDGANAYDMAKTNGFTGTYDDWVLSLHGDNLHIDGYANTVEELPTTYGAGDVVSFVVADILYVWYKQTWNRVGPIRGLAGKDGEDGLSAIEQLAEFYPEVTSTPAMAKFLKGAQGDKGEIGPMGPTGTLRFRGSFESLAVINTLPTPFNGDLAIANLLHYIYDGAVWVETATMNGTNGLNGKDGKDGKDGREGVDGTDGHGVIILGELPDTTNFPAGEFGDAYLIHGVLWIKGKNGWFSGGNLRGNDGTNGMSAYALDVEVNHYFGSVTEWLKTLHGKDGTSALEIAREADPTIIDEPTFLAAMKGDTGETGPMGPGVSIINKLNSVSELPDPATYQPGDGFLIDGHFWGKAGTTWVDCGQVQGPKGDQGKQGIQGVKGNPGSKGERGASVILLQADPGVFDGAVTDVCMNTVTQGVWLKTSLTVWTFVGFFGGGNVYSPNADGKQYIRKGNTWVEFNPASDGKQYVRIGGDWVEFESPEADGHPYVRVGTEWVALNPAEDGKKYARQGNDWVPFVELVNPSDDGKQYVRVGAGWVELVSPAADGKQYVRVGKDWKEFNHYDLVATTTTGACDLSVGNVFKIDNAASSAKTVVISKTPTGRATTVVVLITGNVGAVTWPAGITWGDNTAPELGPVLTNVILFWDGTRFVGSVGAKA